MDFNLDFKNFSAASCVPNVPTLTSFLKALTNTSKLPNFSLINLLIDLLDDFGNSILPSNIGGIGVVSLFFNFSLYIYN